MSEKKYYSIVLPSVRTTMIHTPVNQWPCDGLYNVYENSPKSIKNAVYKIAQYFRREFRYDFVQYAQEEDFTEDESQIFIWTHREYTTNEVVIGAARFNWRKWKDAPDGWALSWVWIHPFEREKGRLSNSWPIFKKKFGDFFVEPPLSNAIRHFMKKHKHVP